MKYASTIHSTHIVDPDSVHDFVFGCRDTFSTTVDQLVCQSASASGCIRDLLRSQHRLGDEKAGFLSVDFIIGGIGFRSFGGDLFSIQKKLNSNPLK
jgi:hypothetical protein